MTTYEHYLLKEKDGEIIAAIQRKDSISEFNRAIEEAVKEHFDADSVTLRRIEDEMEFDVYSVTDGEKELKVFMLEPIAVY